MNLLLFIPVFIGKIVITVSRLFNVGNGGTWPGEIALMFNSQIPKIFFSSVDNGIILVAGTNGKTTTSKMIKHLLYANGFSQDEIISNESGANLVNGVVSSFIQKWKLYGKNSIKWVILETDEAVVPKLVEQLPGNKKVIVVILNLFRDQLDRYGEVDLVAAKWKKALTKLSDKACLILNADDPQIAVLGDNCKIKTTYFGIKKPDRYQKEMEHATDSIYCPKCSNRLSYRGIYFSHLGDWCCINCKSQRPSPVVFDFRSPLPGLYNEYNTQAAAAVLLDIGIDKTNINRRLADFKPAFGRQEEFQIMNKKVKILLSKNPAGFNASLRAIMEMKAKTVIFALNDRIPDGRDVSWIWDADFEMLPANIKIITSGDKVYDMALRIKYCQAKNSTSENLIVEPDLKKAIEQGMKQTNTGETLYILPTYSVMLEIRKILTGRKIL